MRVRVLTLLLVAAAVARAEPMARVGPGVVKPVVTPKDGPKEIAVAPFLLDRFPVTNAEFLAFVKAHPAWRRDRVASLFAEPHYLAHWAGPLRLGPFAPAMAPVVRVSWFAARAFCEARGERLPTEEEWELAAQAGSDQPGFVERILAWFSQPTPKVLPEIGRGAANPAGIYDLHGLIWEWVEDFNGALLGEDDAPDPLRSCAAGAAGSGDRMDYAAYMRAAFRSSLEARFTVANLGFRCAKNLPEDR